MEEEEELEQFLQGDDFFTEEERQEQKAKERRLARKRRLEAIGPVAEDTQKNNILPDSTHIKSENLLSSHVKEEEEGDDSAANKDDFDMFSSSVSPVDTTTSNVVKVAGVNENTKVDRQQDWDDSEGYYKSTIGEVMHLDLPNASGCDIQFKIAGVIGKGVFSTVLKCSTESSNLASPLLPPQVALKVIRHNDTMAKAALNEIRFLQRLTNASSPGVIRLLLPSDNNPIEYRGHTVLVFPYEEYNLRDVLAKFGKGVGLSLVAVRSYLAQMLSGLWQLKQHKIIHSDLKPDNILVSGDYKKIYLADFGSAVDMTEGVEVAPYLVSRFYRAPEIILGLSPTFAIDLWSLAVTAAELFLGKVLFHGANNNDMLNVMMAHLGPCSNRLVRQHLVQTKKFPIPSHFASQVPFLFRLNSEDPVTHQPVYKDVALQSYSATLQAKLLKARSAKDGRVMVMQFADLLQKCLSMDPTKRIDCKAALKHEFFKEKSETTS